MNEVCKNNDYQFLFATFTIKNVTGDKLKDCINQMMTSYHRMFKLTKIKRLIVGSFRSLEVTHNVNKYSKSYDTYHPHFHVIFCVNKSYFHKDYITQAEWAEMWQHCINANYVPIVDIRKIDNSNTNIQKSVAEVAKYTVKSKDYLNIDKALQDKAIAYLDSAMFNKRLIAFQGIFKKIHKELNLDDVEASDADLVNTNNDLELRNDVACAVERYCWHVGYRRYVLLDDNNNAC